MPTGAEEVTALAVVANVADKISNAVQGIDTVVNWVKAQEGFKHNLYTFPLASSSEAAIPSATLASKAAGATRKSSLASNQETKPPETIFLLSLLATGPQEGSSFMDSRADFKIARIPGTTTGSKAQGYIFLSDIIGFDTSIGSQAEIEFSGQELDDGHLLTFKGFVNKVGPGFGHFSGAVIVGSTESRVKVVSAQIVPSEAGRVINSGDYIYFRF